MPWDVWLSCEENGDVGLVYQCDPVGVTAAVARPALGAFNHEAAHSKIILSPFGWGELCLRDFEAVFNGALLLKPDMSHLETWPDIFVPGETYIPFGWDAEDLVDQAERYLTDETARLAIARAAAERYRSQLAELPRRFEGILAEIQGDR